MKIPANQLQSALKKSLLSCYLVTGDEPLLVQEALDAIRGEARRQGFDARELYVAGQGFDWAELTIAAGNLSLFAERRILELRLPTGKPGVQGAAAIVAMVDLVQKAGDDLLFVVSAPKLEKGGVTSKWARSIESAGGLVQAWPMTANELPKWIDARMRQRGLIPDREVAQLIADRVEGNLLAADQEIEKLRLLQGEGAVTGVDVENAVADSSRYDVYKLADAAVAGDAVRALRILGGVRAEGVEAVIVVWALTRELRVLVKLADSVRSGLNLGTALNKAGVWRNRQEIVRACVARHAPADFYRLLQTLRQADAAAKGQLALDPWQLTTDIVVGLAMGRAKAA